VTANRWRQITEVFHAARERDAATRAAYLSDVCDNDADLRAQVEVLLAANDEFRMADSRSTTSQELLAPGTGLGPYRIDTLIGAGGMGDVYRATDVRLDRVVAIKILPRHLRASSESQARFEREARTVSHLTHPHICTLHDVGHEWGMDFLVMEYLDGETLATRLSRGVIPLDETLTIGIDIADALDHAHRQGVVHRDLKPANVMLTSVGAKLLDFGIARERTAGTSATATTRTAAGRATIAGTPPYMAPEQTLGLAVSARSDLFALGVVLYECLTGQLPLPQEGGTRDIGLLESVAPAAPAPLRSLVGSCLAVAPANRPSSAAVVRSELRSVQHALQSANSMRRAMVMLTMVAIIVGAGVYGLWPRGTTDSARPFTTVPFVTDRSADYDARISPDGRWISFISDRGGAPALFVQSIDGSEPRPINVPGDAVLSHTWSPDGREFACVVRQKDQTVIEIMAAFTGGLPRVSAPLSGVVEDARVARWTATGIYIDVDRGLEGHPLLHADPADLHTQDITAGWGTQRIDYRGFDVSPDGQSVVFVAIAGAQTNLWSAHLDGSGRHQLTNDTWLNRFPVWLGSTGRIAFQTNRTGQLDLWILDPSSGQATPVTSSPSAEEPTDSTADGSLLLFEQTVEGATLWRQDLSIPRAHQLTANTLSDFWPSVSADGRWLAFQRTRPSLTRGYNFLDARVLAAELEPAGLSSVTEVSNEGINPQLSSDGTWVVYLRRASMSTEYGLWACNIRTGERKLIANNAAVPATGRSSPFDVAAQVLAWSATGPTLYFVRRVAAGQEIARADLARGTLETFAPARAELVRDLRSNRSNLAYLRWSPTRRTFRLHIRDLNTLTERVWPEESGTAYLRGWTATGGLVVVLSTLNADGTSRIAVEERRAIAETRPIAALDDALATTSRVNASGTRLYVTRSARGVHNIWYIDLADGKFDRLTDNEQLGVSYSGVAPLPNGSVLYSRLESRRDIWIARSNQHP
jgi:protein kinase-like protein/WD40 repeat protein